MKESLRGVQAAHPGQRVCLWSQDESRFGLHTIQRRRLTLPGVKPICPFEQAFESFWLCGAVAPNTGEAFALELPATDGDSACKSFWISSPWRTRKLPTELQVLLMDNGGAHRAKKLRWPKGVTSIFLPAYCPELNPIERWWQELKDALSNQLFGTLDALRAPFGQGTRRLEPRSRTPLLTHQLPLPHRRPRIAGLNLRNGMSCLLRSSWPTPKAYSLDLRERVWAAWQQGESSQPQVAARFGVSESFVRDLSRRFRATGSVAAKLHGGGRRLAADAKTIARLEALVAKRNDLTHDEYHRRLCAKGAASLSRASVGRLLLRLGLTRKKRRSKTTSGEMSG